MILRQARGFVSGRPAQALSKTMAVTGLKGFSTLTLVASVGELVLDADLQRINAQAFFRDRLKLQGLRANKNRSDASAPCFHLRSTALSEESIAQL